MKQDNAATIVIAYIEKLNSNTMSKDGIVKLYEDLIKAEKGEKTGS